MQEAAPTAIPMPRAAPCGIPMSLCSTVIVVVAMANATISMRISNTAAAFFIISVN